MKHGISKIQACLSVLLFLNEPNVMGCGSTEARALCRRVSRVETHIGRRSKRHLKG